jgi:hypothetical protein
LRFGRAALALAAFGLIIAAAFQASPQQSPCLAAIRHAAHGSMSGSAPPAIPLMPTGSGRCMSMGIRVRLAEDRADIIAYLRQEAGQLAP